MKEGNTKQYGGNNHDLFVASPFGKILNSSETLQGQWIGLYTYLQSFVFTLRDEKEFGTLESRAKERCKMYKKKTCNKEKSMKLHFIKHLN